MIGRIDLARDYRLDRPAACCVHLVVLEPNVTGRLSAGP
jgi:hypothetical protein